MTESEHDNAAAVFAPLIFDVLSFRVFATAVRLGIPGAVGDGSRSTADLAAGTQTDPAALHRLLRALAALGVVRRDGADTWSLTGAGGQLRDGAPGGIADLVRFYGDPLTWRAFGAMEETVRTGGTAFEQVSGDPFFAYFERDVAYARAYNGAMRAGTHMLLPLLQHSYDWGAVDRLVDVGGGDGTTLTALAAAHPKLRGVVFDTAEAVRGVPELARAAGVADRCTGEAGDFLSTVPAGADAYLLKNVLHEWDDASCTRILRNCRESMADGGRVLVVAALAPEWDDDGNSTALMYAAISDIQLLCLSGKERTENEYAALFAAAGLRLEKTVPLPYLPNYHVIEATAAR
ncbi:methyltransferase [Streptomyces sp. HD]|uniref:methyltransferase n=1 Tax=Streptomyces sp. HD TaxID=3020892 RepID=UPI00232E1A08|nr:methyltransferase [Streptomyces sp. HD]MDC0772605.1 methyltransferase [Streptomyces sp. HD]